MRNLVMSAVMLAVGLSAAAQGMSFMEDDFLDLPVKKKDVWNIVGYDSTGAEIRYMDPSDLSHAIMQTNTIMEQFGLVMGQGKMRNRFDGIVVVDWDTVYNDEFNVNIPVRVTYAYSVKDLSFHRILLQFLY